MVNCTESSASRKPAQAYYCTYLGLSGVLTRPVDAVLFLDPHNGAVITLTPAEVLRDVVVNGAVAEAMEQYIADLANGGAAFIATHRAA